MQRYPEQSSEDPLPLNIITKIPIVRLDGTLSLFQTCSRNWNSFSFATLEFCQTSADTPPFPVDLYFFIRFTDCSNSSCVRFSVASWHCGSASSSALNFSCSVWSNFFARKFDHVSTSSCGFWINFPFASFVGRVSVKVFFVSHTAFTPLYLFRVAHPVYMHLRLFPSISRPNLCNRFCTTLRSPCSTFCGLPV